MVGSSCKACGSPNIVLVTTAEAGWLFRCGRCGTITTYTDEDVIRWIGELNDDANSKR